MGECSPYAPKWSKCLPCSNGQQCISFTGAREFFKILEDEQIENMCENFKLTFNKSVRTRRYKGAKTVYALTPPWGLLGLGYSLRECSFTSDNYLSHHALGTMAERLVERGMLAAEGEDVNRSDGGAGQQPHPVDAGSE